MAREIVMPALEMAQSTSVLVRWLKAEGELVRKGEPLMEIETEKALTEIEAPDSGILSNISAQPGDEVPVGRVIALLLPAPEQSPAPKTPSSSTAVQGEGETEQQHEAATTVKAPVPCEPLESRLAPGSLAVPKLPPASPKARRLAAERKINLPAVASSDASGPALTQDVLRASAEAQAPAAQTAEYKIVPIKGRRRTIAERLQRSHQTAPHVSLTLSIEMSQARRFLEPLSANLELAGSPRLSITAILAKAVATALVQHPRLNAHLVEQEIREHHVVHLGVAVALEDGLVVPVIRNAERKNIPAIQSELDELIGRARSARLQAEEIKGSTFTISNLGMFGVEQFSAILNSPEVGILSVGTIRDQPVEVEGRVVFLPMMQVTINVDHRAVDGAVAARFLSSLKEILEHPGRFLA